MKRELTEDLLVKQFHGIKTLNVAHVKPFFLQMRNTSSFPYLSIGPVLDKVSHAADLRLCYEELLGMSVAEKVLAIARSLNFRWVSKVVADLSTVPLLQYTADAMFCAAPHAYYLANMLDCFVSRSKWAVEGVDYTPSHIVSALVSFYRTEPEVSLKGYLGFPLISESEVYVTSDDIIQAGCILQLSPTELQDALTSKAEAKPETPSINCHLTDTTAYVVYDSHPDQLNYSRGLLSGSWASHFKDAKLMSLSEAIASINQFELGSTAQKSTCIIEVKTTFSVLTLTEAKTLDVLNRRAMLLAQKAEIEKQLEAL